VTDFGAFVVLETGVEGLIHISEMSWVKRVRKPSDLVKTGETVEAVILGLNEGERRMSLGLKQALGDPWADARRMFPVGSVAEGPVVNIAKFGAFVQVAEGIEGLIHISDMSAEKRINHPQDVLKVGQLVRAQVLELDTEKRRLKLGIKQMVPTSIDEYLSEHREGDVVSGRVMDVLSGSAHVELGQGIQAMLQIAAKKAKQEPSATGQAVPVSAKSDLASLGAMLQARWKSGAALESSEPGEIRAGQVRSFRITRLDRAAKKIELEPV
jgi:small subunit ribosomal protein S1